MRIGSCFFMESNLGGAATQADDLVTVAKHLGHSACLLRFTHNPRSKNLYSFSEQLPIHQLLIGKSGIRFTSERVLLTDPRCKKFMKSFDVLIFVGGCPHITRTYAAEDFQQHYQWLYDLPASKFIFLTDPFWKRLYPFLKDIIDEMDGVYAFAEAYKNIVESSGLCDKIGICNFGSVAALNASKNVSLANRQNCVVWPHQWRSWKNPELMINLAPLLSMSVKAYSDGIEYHKIRRDHMPEFKKAVANDLVKGDCNNPDGKLTYYGTVPQPRIVQEFKRCMWMVDFTGMSARTGKPLEKFIGNYQCVNMESMMLGCVNIKYKNTIHPHSQIPMECVVPLDNSTDPVYIANVLNSTCSSSIYVKVSKLARDWALANFNPIDVFKQSFLN